VSAAAPAGPGVPFLRLVRVELRKQVDTRAGAGLLIAIAVIGAAVVVGQLWIADPALLTWQFLADGASIGWTVLLPLLGIMAATGEWTQRTALQTFALEPRRTRVNLAKVVAALLLGLALFACTYLVAAAVNAVAALAVGGDGSWALDGGIVLGSLTTMAIYVVMGVAFGLALLSTPVAIVAYLVLPMALSLLGLVPALREIVPWIDLTSALLPVADWSLTADQAARAATAVALWIALPLGLGLWRTARREVA